METWHATIHWLNSSVRKVGNNHSGFKKGVRLRPRKVTVLLIWHEICMQLWWIVLSDRAHCLEHFYYINFFSSAYFGGSGSYISCQNNWETPWTIDGFSIKKKADKEDGLRCRFWLDSQLIYWDSEGVQAVWNSCWYSSHAIGEPASSGLKWRGSVAEKNSLF